MDELNKKLDDLNWKECVCKNGWKNCGKRPNKPDGDSESESEESESESESEESENENEPEPEDPEPEEPEPEDPRFEICERFADEGERQKCRD